jgi:two-component system chemotaxis sensor kinase CheA
MSDAQQAILQEFLVESFDNLSNIHDDLGTYEKNPADKELLNSIYRKIHTLKGSASFLGLKTLQEITHTVESILDYVRDETITVSTELFDIFLESFDVCQVLLKNIEESGKEGEEEYKDLVSRLNRILETTIASGENMMRDESYQEVNLAANGDSVPVEAPKVESADLKIVKEEAPVKSADEKPAPSTDGGLSQSSPAVEKASRGTISDSIVRVNVNLLDKIMNVVGELVITRNQILQFAKLKDDSDLNRYAQQLNTITTELQTDIMTTRMQPVGSVFNKFERIVRDLSRAQKKKVRLQIVGQETELDKTLLEVIKDPMTHLIRNSLDHGLETAEVREAAGKRPEGLLEIKAFHEGGQVIIEICDDGAGINADKVKAKAIEKGVLTAEEANALSLSKVHSLIFHPGFSTAEQVTNISGRGVGMDVVKSNIEKIGGEVEVLSEMGKGTVFRLKIPLTLAIVPALVIESGDETFAIHQKNLVELVMLESDDFDKIEKLHGREFFRLRGELIPIVRLNEVLHIGKENEESHFLNIIVLKAEGKTYGLIVDDILDTQEIVVKPLDKALKSMSYYAGSTIMGDGRVALIIDAFGFYNQIDNKDGRAEKELVTDEQNFSNQNFDAMEVVLFKLGDSRVYGIPLSIISRLEEFDPTKVEWAGEQSLIRYRGHSMPLLNVEKILNLKGKSSMDLEAEEKLNCIVVTINGVSFGFIVTEIIDIAWSESVLETETIDRDGLLGTVYIEEKLITLIDIYKLVSATEVGKRVSGADIKMRLSGKVLLVDDSPLYRRVQEDLLREAGIEVIIATNGREALRLFKENEGINAIITDIEMPILNGYEFSEEIRQENKEIPIIAVSTKAGPEDIERGKSVGFTYHLEKLNKKEVLETLDRCLTM